MGLNEKRHVKKLEDETIPAVKSEIKQIADIDLDIEIKWDGISEDWNALNNIENTLLILPKAFRDICTDDLGKQSVKTGVHKALFVNEKADDVVMSDGVIHIAYNWAWGCWSDESIRRAMEKAL